MKEMQELALAVKSVTNTGFIQLKPLHSLIRKEWLAWVYFRRLASVSARTAVCSELISGVIPLSPSPSCQKPRAWSQRPCQVPGHTVASRRCHSFGVCSQVCCEKQHPGQGQSATISSSSPVFNSQNQETLPSGCVELGRCWRQHLAKALPLPCSQPRAQVHSWPLLSQPATAPVSPELPGALLPHWQQSQL